MMRHRQERMEAMRHMRARMDPMQRIGAYAPPHVLERREVLGLTAEQVSGLEALAEELKQAHETAEAEAKAHREQLLEVWEAERPDIGQLRSHAEAAMEAEHGAHLAMLSAAAQAKALLTPEQRGRVEGWVDARHMMMHRRMHPMGGNRTHRMERRHRRPGDSP